MEIFNAETVFALGAECQGWNDQGDIEIALTADGTGVEFFGVVDDGGRWWTLPIPDVVSLSFLAFLRGKGGDEARQGDFVMRRCECCGVVAIGQE